MSGGGATLALRKVGGGVAKKYLSFDVLNIEIFLPGQPQITCVYP